MLELFCFVFLTRRDLLVPPRQREGLRVLKRCLEHIIISVAGRGDNTGPTYSPKKVITVED